MSFVAFGVRAIFYTSTRGRAATKKEKRTRRRKVAKDRKENLCGSASLRESFCFFATTSLVIEKAANWLLFCLSLLRLKLRQSFASGRHLLAENSCFPRSFYQGDDCPYDGSNTCADGRREHRPENGNAASRTHYGWGMV